MKTSLVLAALVALTFTTGFTCSKNSPAPEGQEQAAPSSAAAPSDAAPQDSMGAPADSSAAPTESSSEPSAPVETAPTGTEN